MHDVVRTAQLRKKSLEGEITGEGDWRNGARVLRGKMCSQQLTDFDIWELRLRRLRKEKPEESYIYLNCKLARANCSKNVLFQKILLTKYSSLFLGNFCTILSFISFPISAPGYANNLKNKVKLLLNPIQDSPKRNGSISYGQEKQWCIMNLGRQQCVPCSLILSKLELNEKQSVKLCLLKTHIF